MMSWVWLPSAQEGETKRPGGQLRDSGDQKLLPAPLAQSFSLLPRLQEALRGPSLLPTVKNQCAWHCQFGAFSPGSVLWVVFFTRSEHKHWGQASLCDIGQVALPLWASLFSPG